MVVNVVVETVCEVEDISSCKVGSEDAVDGIALASSVCDFVGGLVEVKIDVSVEFGVEMVVGGVVEIELDG